MVKRGEEDRGKKEKWQVSQGPGGEGERVRPEITLREDDKRVEEDNSGRN